MNVIYRFAAWMGLCAGVALTSELRGQSECAAPPGATAVDDFYQPDINGGWWLVPQGTTVSTPMDSPSVLRISSQYGTWTYVVGTSPGYNEGNLAIYRTQDFRTFVLHMPAFNPALQPANGSAVYLNNGRIFCKLRNPQMYIDWGLVVPLPAGGAGSTDGGGDTGDDSDDDDDNSVVPELADPPQDESSMGVDPVTDATGATDPVINLTFSAITSSGAPSTDESLRGCFQVRMRRSDFLSWHNSTAPRKYFAQAGGQFPWQAWFGYIPGNGAGAYAYDGGFSQNMLIPASGSSALIGPNLGQVFRQDLSLTTFGLAHRGVSPRASWMYDHPFVYLNNSPAPGNRVQFFTFANVPTPSNLQNGFHIAGHPTRTSQFLFDATSNTQAFANNYNTNNLVNGVLNGAIGPGGGGITIGGTSSAIATGACAFSYGGRHYLLYCRNSENSPAYQIVYRKTGVGQPVTDLITGFFGGGAAPEGVLLRASTYNLSSGYNYGNPEVFWINSSFQGPSLSYPFLAFRVGIPVGGGFTYRPMFKELTFDPNTGDILPLAEGGPDVRADIYQLRLPRCRY